MTAATGAAARARTARAEAIAVRRGRAGVRLVAAPPPAAAALRILRAGVCGTDLQIAAGLRPDRATILGHEALALTPDGGPVVLNPVGERDQDSILGHSYDGVFRAHAALPGPDDGGPTLVPAAPDLLADLAPLSEPLAAALYGWELVAGARDPSTVGVWGDGFLGLACALVACLHGAAVVLTGHTERRATWVRRHLGLPARTATGDRLPVLDAAFLCVPRTSAAAALAEASGAVRAGGVIDLAGGMPAGMRVGADPATDAAALRRGNVRGHSTLPGGLARVRRADGRWLGVTGHRGTADTHLRQAQGLLTAHPERFRALVSHVVSLRGAAELINRVCVAGHRTDRDGREIVKVVIDPALPGGRRDPDPRRTVGDLARAC